MLDDSSDGSDGVEPRELEYPEDGPSEDGSEEEDDSEYSEEEEEEDYGDEYDDHYSEEDYGENDILQSDIIDEYLEQVMLRHAVPTQAAGWAPSPDQERYQRRQEGDRSWLVIARVAIWGCWFHLFWPWNNWFCDGWFQWFLFRALLTGFSAIVWYSAELKLSGLQQSAIPPITRSLTRILLLAQWAQSKARRVIKWFPLYLIVIVLALVVLLLHLVPLTLGAMLQGCIEAGLERL